MKRKDVAVLVFLIMLTFVLLGVLFYFTFNLLKETTNCAEQLISVIGVAVGFVGTMVLGIIAYWQTKQANTISTLVIEKENELDIKWMSPILFSVQKFSSLNVMNFAETCPVEGVICSVKKDKSEDEVDYLEMDFPFELCNGNIEELRIENIGFNYNYDSDTYKIGLNILNEKPIIVAYNPKEKKYILSFYIECDFAKLKYINDKGMFTLDFNLIVLSKFGLKFNYTIQANFKEVQELDSILQKKLQCKEINLENILITKEKCNGKSKNTKTNRKKK